MSRRRGKLTGEDRALWQQVAKTARPLPGRMEQLLASSAEPPRAAETETVPPPEKPIVTDAMRRALAAGLRGEPSSHAQPPERKGPDGRTGSPIERPVHRKLAKGRLPLEGRLDLHGLDRAEAHTRLLRFLRDAQHRGMRHVLVITGKGSSFGSEGALRRVVPLWLAGPGLADVVSGHDLASRGHGGEGALYVRLKRRRRL